MTVIARDGVAADHLVYAWPFPLGPECEVTCGDDEEVVMCPAWLVGERLGPGHHRYRTPDPMRPVSAFFVLTSPVEVSFDLTTMFLIPATRQPVRLRAQGSLQVRCGDPGLLIAQFVGLPFDHVNDGILRSVSRSVERMLARLLTRRVVMAGTPLAVTDPSMHPSIIEELVAYNPTAGAVFGIELMRMGHLAIGYDEGHAPYVMMPGDIQPGRSGEIRPGDVHGEVHAADVQAGEIRSGDIRSGDIRSGEIRSGDIRSGEIRSGEIGGRRRHRDQPTQPSPVVPPPDATPAATSGRLPKGESLLHTMRGTKPADPAAPSPLQKQGGAAPIIARHSSLPPGAVSGEIGRIGGESTDDRAAREPSGPRPPARIGVDPATERATNERSGPSVAAVSGEIVSRTKSANDVPAPRVAGALEVPKTDDIEPPTPPAPARPAYRPTPTTPVPGAIKIPNIPPIPVPPMNKPAMAAPKYEPLDEPDEQPRGSIVGIGMSPIGSTGAVAGEIPSKVAPGGRVLVPGPNGLMQSATVRQLLQGYYELEVGSSGETIWVPISGVVPE